MWGVSHLSGVTCYPGGCPNRVFQDGEVQGQSMPPDKTVRPQKRCIYVWVCLTLWK